MSVKYGLLAAQQETLLYVINQLPESEPEHIKRDLNNIKSFLEYISEERDSANLNEWQDSCDHAANQEDES